jgi:hypothetical protein
MKEKMKEKIKNFWMIIIVRIIDALSSILGWIREKTKVPDPRDKIIEDLESKLEVFYRKKWLIEKGIDPGKLEIIILDFHIKSLEERLKQPGWTEGERRSMEKKIESMRKQLHWREGCEDLGKTEEDNIGEYNLSSNIKGLEKEIIKNKELFFSLSGKIKEILERKKEET